MKKIGIMSIHSAHNYGSVLQAYALQEVLKSFSNNVEIINYRPGYFEMLYKLFSVKVYKKYPGFLNKVVHFVWRIINLFSRFEKIKKFERFIKSNYTLSDKRFNKYEELERYNFDYDIVFVGSDQVWNTDITEGFDKSYYLEFLPKNTVKSSYAASIARKYLDERYIDSYIRALNNFDFISVREKTGKNTLEEVIDKHIEVSIDPTLLLDRKKWDLISKQSKININKRYIFTYVLQDNPEIVKIVNDVSAELGLPVVSISKKKRFKNEIIFPNAGPEDFVNLIKNSSFVITNSFHGTAFSVIYEKSNYIVPHLNTGSRMIDLMNMLGLNDRVIRNSKELKKGDALKKVDYKHAYSIIKREHDRSNRYLHKVMSYEQR